MPKNRLRKSITFGIFCMVIGIGMIPSLSGDVATLGLMEQNPQGAPLFDEEHSVICGYVTDGVTGAPLEVSD
jgi:hypothetical protein